jgi:hypothetical protein
MHRLLRGHRLRHKGARVSPLRRAARSSSGRRSCPEDEAGEENHNADAGHPEGAEPNLQRLCGRGGNRRRGDRRDVRADGHVQWFRRCAARRDEARLLCCKISCCGRHFRSRSWRCRERRWHGWIVGGSVGGASSRACRSSIRSSSDWTSSCTRCWLRRMAVISARSSVFMSRSVPRQRHFTKSINAITSSIPSMEWVILAAC